VLYFLFTNKKNIDILTHGLIFTAVMVIV